MEKDKVKTSVIEVDQDYLSNDTYCILVDKSLWLRWITTSRKFGFKDLESSQEHNATFIQLLLDIADASPIETNSSASTVVSPHQKQSIVSVTEATEESEDTDDGINIHKVMNDFAEEVQFVDDANDPDFKPHVSSGQRHSRRVRKRKVPFDEQHTGVKSGGEYHKVVTYHDGEGNSAVECAECHVMFVTNDELEEHMAAEHQMIEEVVSMNPPRRRGRPPSTKKFINVYHCAPCDMFFKRKPEFENHQDLVHSNVRYPCEVCGKLYKSRLRVYHHHRSSHTGVKPRFQAPTVCSTCGRTFRGQSALKAHHESVHVGTRYECEVCGRLFTTKFCLTTHVATQHEKDKQLVCNICHQTYYHPHQLKRHQKAAHDTSLHQCHVCHKRFQGELKLKTHMMSHSDVRNYVCAVCNKAFKWQSHLRRHEKFVHKVGGGAGVSGVGGVVNTLEVPMVRVVAGEEIVIEEKSVVKMD